MPNQSPEVKEAVVVEQLPKCVKCGEDVRQIKWVDYEATRVVMHTGPGCVLGVMAAPQEKEPE